MVIKGAKHYRKIHERRATYLLFRDQEQLVQTFDDELLCDFFEADAHQYIAEMAQGKIFVHAGVVGWQDQAIILPGSSLSGKTTLVAELVRAGATYYSDEYAVLDKQGRVHPFARPLSIRLPGRSARQQRCPVESLGGAAGVTPLPVGLVVMSAYKPGAVWRPRRCSAGQGLMLLMANTISIRRQPEVALAFLRQVVMHAPVIKSSRGEARQTAEAIIAYSLS